MCFRLEICQKHSDLTGYCSIFKFPHPGVCRDDVKHPARPLARVATMWNETLGSFNFDIQINTRCLEKDRRLDIMSDFKGQKRSIIY